MHSILMVSSTEKASAFLYETLNFYGYFEVTNVSTCGEARRLLIERTFDLCIINAPLSDESGEKLALQIIGEKANQVILLVKNEYFAEVSGKVEDYGVFTLGKPFTRSAFWAAFKFAEACHKRMGGMAAENEKLKRMLAEIKVISRAKCLLVEKKLITEEDAHKIIEQRAMDRRMTRAEIAREIIEKYE